MNYSVLMSVYYKERPEYLKEAMESIFKQTLKTNDFVLICDGPLNDELDLVISQMKEKFGRALSVIRLQENVGLGNALNEGIKHCKNEIIARMDSDDIAYPNRCEIQLRTLVEKNVDILSAGVDEFSYSIENVDVRRIPPETHEEILNFAKKRNPFNHPCVMYKKSAVQNCGGYQDFYLLEDYYLWIRMLMKGCKSYNIQDSLLWMRAGSDMYKRRSGKKHAISQIRLFKYMYNQKFITKREYYNACLIRSAASLSPNFIREFLFKKVLRKKKG